MREGKVREGTAAPDVRRCLTREHAVDEVRVGEVVLPEALSAYGTEQLRTYQALLSRARASGKGPSGDLPPFNCYGGQSVTFTVTP